MELDNVTEEQVQKLIQNAKLKGLILTREEALKVVEDLKQEEKLWVSELNPEV